MFGHEDRRIERLTDAAIAEEMAAGRFPDGDTLKEIRIQVEVAATLADLADNDPGERVRGRLLSRAHRMG